MPDDIRTTITLSAEHRERLEQAKSQRNVTFNEVIASALTAYFTQDRDKVLFEQIHKTLWNLDSATQRQAERLTHLEGAVQQLMELVGLIADQMTTSETSPVPEPEGETITVPQDSEALTATITMSEDQSAHDTWLQDMNGGRGLPKTVAVQGRTRTTKVPKRRWIAWGRRAE